jgi:hypothetical protein
VEGPAVVLGAVQRAGRVVDLPACAAAGVRVLRRTTTGTAAFVEGKAVLWTLALPRVDALLPDATPRTLLNRNVRPFLKALRSAGLTAHYFGREWIAVRHRPAALLAFEVLEGGAVLIEVLAGVDHPIGLPFALAAPAEREIDRWLGKIPIALAEGGERVPAARPIALSSVEAITALAGAAAEPSVSAPNVGLIVHPDDPVPPGLELGPVVRVPIGWLDTAFDRATGRAWLGGDVLAPTAVLAAIAAGDTPAALDAPIEGATLADLARAARVPGGFRSGA